MRKFTAKCSSWPRKYLLQSLALVFGGTVHMLCVSHYLVQNKYYVTTIESNMTNGTTVKLQPSREFHGCEVKKANATQCSIAKDGCVPFFVASFPGSGAALTINLYIALTGFNTIGVSFTGVKEKQDVYSSSYFKTHQPVNSGEITNEGNFRRAIVVVRNPLDAIPSYYNQRYEMTHKVRWHHANQAPLDSWIEHRDNHFSTMLNEWQRHFETWMSLDLDEKLFLSFESLVDNDLGPSVMTKMAVFFNKTGGILIPDTEEVKCVWYKVAKNGESKRRIESKRVKKYDPPYTPRQMMVTSSMLRGLIRKYKKETIIKDLRRYRVIIKDKIKISKEKFLSKY